MISISISPKAIVAFEAAKLFRAIVIQWRGHIHLFDRLDGKICTICTKVQEHALKLKQTAVTAQQFICVNNNQMYTINLNCKLRLTVHFPLNITTGS